MVNGAKSSLSFRFGAAFRLWLALTLLVVGSYVAVNQSQRPNPTEPLASWLPWQNDSSQRWDFWRYPLETNAYWRLPSVLEDMAGIFALEDGQRLWAVGKFGMIVHSTDGGQSWHKQNSKTNEWLFAVQFHADGQRGWAVGSSGTILSTADGGQTWQSQTSTKKEELQAVQFQADGQHGWVVGLGGEILSSTDGGQHWQEQFHSKSLLTSLRSLADGRRGLAISRGNTIGSWLMQANGTEVLVHAIQFLVDGQHGWVVGNKGSIFATTDGGQRWQAQTSPTDKDLSGVQLLADGQRGWVVGKKGSILTTTDGGQRWQAQTSGTDEDLIAVQFLADGQRGWIVGDSGTILTTADGGQNWQTLTRSKPLLRSVQFLAGGQRGWTVGGNGTILTTSDGGQSWEAQASGTKEYLTDVEFLPDGQRGWAVGNGGIILTSIDSGQSWQAQASVTKDRFHDVHFQTGGRRGWIVGTNGTILTTSDGGQSWQAQISDTTYHLQAIQVQNDNGWVVGNSGTILTSTDGGQSWHTGPNQNYRQPNAIQFLADSKHGWVVGMYGEIFSTVDGGKNWKLQASNTKEELVAVHFQTDGQRGWVVGANGTILTTTNGGLNWQAPPKINRAKIHDIQFQADGLRGWAVGSNATILTTFDGGEHWQPAPNKRSHWPAPWYYLTWLVSLLLLLNLPWWQPPGATLPKQDPDRPWQPGDQDRMAFQPIAKALSRLLTNADNQPPLTVAITADWGRGKSSLMTMLRQELQAEHYRCVEFNAWHQQDEARVLDSLLESIRNQMVPGFFSLRGLWLRIRLLWRRDGWPRWLLALSLIGWAYGVIWPFLELPGAQAEYTALSAIDFENWWYQQHGWRESAVLTAGDLNKLCKDDPNKAAETPAFDTRDCLAMQAQLTWQAATVLTVPPAKSSKSQAKSNAREKETLSSPCKWQTDGQPCRFASLERLQQTVANVVGHDLTAGQKLALQTTHSRLPWPDDKSGTVKQWLTVLAASFGLGLLPLLYTEITVLGENRLLKLFKPLLDRFNIDGSSLEVAGQHKLHQERFASLVRVLSGELVIFIDDLDRCRQEHAAKVLEVVNFLSSARPSCFFVLGFFPDYMKACVGLNFSEIAVEMIKEQPLNDGSNVSEQQREREIFAHRYLQKLINVEAPLPKPQLAQIRKILGDPGKVRPSLEQRLIEPIRRIVAWLDYSPAALLLVLVAVGVAMEWFWQPEPAPAAVELVVTTKTAPPNGKTETQPKPAEPNATGSVVTPALPENKQAWLAVPIAAGLLLVLGLLMALRQQPQWLENYRLITGLRRSLNRLWPSKIKSLDSQRFQKALLHWQDVITEKADAPRNLKAFKNRARYFAILAEEIYRANPKRFDLAQFNETHWLALAAIHYVEPALLDFEPLYRDKFGVTPERWQPITNNAEQSERFRRLEVKVKHAITTQQWYGCWPPSEQDRELLVWLAEGMKIH